MSSLRTGQALGTLLLLTAASLIYAEKQVAGKWEIQYSFEENDSALTITDLKFWSPERGVASGFIEKRVTNAILGDRNKEIPTMLVTSNGGKSWAQVQVKERPLSLFLLGDSTGWMVASEGLWVTTEAGRAWKRISSVKNLLQVYFLSPAHGFAAGSSDQALETVNGGVTWSPIVREAATPGAPSRKPGFEFSLIQFANPKQGIIAGAELLPAGAEAVGRKHFSSFLTTSNGGTSWRQAYNAMAGQMTSVSFSGDGNGLALIQNPDSYPWPSELFHIKLGTDEDNRLVYRDRTKAITDVLLLEDGTAFLAGSELPGNAHRSPIPGKVKILQSKREKDWSEMPVDYRAIARQVMLAPAGPDDVWAATDTGTILKLSK